MSCDLVVYHYGMSFKLHPQNPQPQPPAECNVRGLREAVPLTYTINNLRVHSFLQHLNDLECRRKSCQCFVVLCTSLPNASCSLQHPSSLYPWYRYLRGQGRDLNRLEVVPLQSSPNKSHLHVLYDKLNIQRS